MMYIIIILILIIILLYKKINIEKFRCKNDVEYNS
jgi:hypothetical protein